MLYLSGNKISSINCLVIPREATRIIPKHIHVSRKRSKAYTTVVPMSQTGEGQYSRWSANAARSYLLLLTLEYQPALATIGQKTTQKKSFRLKERQHINRNKDMGVRNLRTITTAEGSWRSSDWLFSDWSKVASGCELYCSEGCHVEAANSISIGQCSSFYWIFSVEAFTG
jgi:hypothetical protein